VAIHGRITGIVDGDTLNVLILSKQQIRVRIAFIDAPERGQAFGQRAKETMSVFEDVELWPHTIDRYGRLVATVYVNDNDGDVELLKQGFCWVYEKYVGQAPDEIQARYRDSEEASWNAWPVARP
jgi:endonuclease YncB( thermonuclease family)